MRDVIAEYREREEQILSAIRGDGEGTKGDALWLEVFAFQRRWNRPYANFCATRPEPRDWREIPAVPVSAFKRAALCVVPPERVARTFLTSGTTGETRGAHHFVDTRLYDAAAQCGWNRLGLAPHEQCVLVAAEAEAPQSSLSHMMAALRTGGAAQRYFIDPAGRLRMAELLRALEEKIAAQEPVALLGTALAFLNAFEAMEERRLALPAGSYAMETGGYKGSGRDIPKAELYAKFSQYLALPGDQVLNEYGMTELSSQFYTRGLGQPHTAGPWLRTLVIDPETGGEAAIGGTGVLRIFDLANLGSVLAIETRDLAIRRDEGFELLGRDPAALPRGCSRAADEMLNT